MMGVGARLARMEWHPPGLSVPLPSLSSSAPQNPETMMARNPGRAGELVEALAERNVDVACVQEMEEVDKGCPMTRTGVSG